jgi:hypothetical protein
MSAPDLTEEAFKMMIDQLLRHKAAFNSRSDLKIGRSTINCDYEESISLLRRAQKALFPDHQ